MWALYGIQITVGQKQIGDPFEDYYDRTLIALFSTYKAACDYVKLSYTSAERKQTVHIGVSGRYPFYKKSLLGLYNDFEIEAYHTFSVPIDPEP